MDAAGDPPDCGIFSINGTAQKVSDHHWRHEDGMESSNPSDRCQVDIMVDNKGWHISTAEDAQCLGNKGIGAPNEAPIFPLNSYVAPVTTELDPDGGLVANGGNGTGGKTVTGDDCNSQPPTPTRAPAAPKP